MYGSTAPPPPGREKQWGLNFEEKQKKLRENLPTQLVFFHVLILPSPLSEPLAAARKKKGNQATGVFFSAHPPYPQFVCVFVFVFVVIISRTLLLMSNVKSLTTTSSDEDPTYRLTQYLQVPISTRSPSNLMGSCIDPYRYVYPAYK